MFLNTLNTIATLLFDLPRTMAQSKKREKERICVQKSVLIIKRLHSKHKLVIKKYLHEVKNVRLHIISETFLPK